MEAKNRYFSVRRTNTMDEVREDNERCDWLLSQEISYMVSCPDFPGRILYPDNEVTAYRPIDDALPISFHSYLSASTYLDEVREKAWLFNITLGVNEHGEPPVEKWTDLAVMVMWQVAEGRKRYNNVRIELMEEREHLYVSPKKVLRRASYSDGN